MIGKTISHYKIIEEIGRGGMGMVYKAEDTKLKRTVALKFLPSEFTHDQESKERFTREAHAASALDHNNICTIHEIDETDDGQLFIVMACYEGKTLKEKIKDHKLKTKEAIDIAMQIAKGLQRAHKKGIIHRDIKPANIFITNDGNVKILDFGLAKLAGRAQLTKDSSTLGTVAYMSPEQISGEEVDHRSDIWSLGVVLYEMLTGDLPFKGDYEQAIMYSILNEDPTHDLKYKDELSNHLESILKKVLKKNPDDRYQSITEIQSDLEKKTNEQTFIHRLNKRSGKEDKPSMAVLPFVNISSDPENEYFSDGLTEELINALTKLKNIRVVARTSAFAFKSKQADIRDIGNQLGVQWVLEGSVRKSGKRIRITAQMISVEDGYHLWSEKYDCNLEDIFAIQDEIASKISEKLQSQFPEAISELQKGKRPDVSAYELYLQGRYYFSKFSPEWTLKAQKAYLDAISIDPSFALAYAGLADTYVFLTNPIGLLDGREALPKARDAAEEALRLEPKLSEAYAALGSVATYLDWDIEKAQTYFEKAIALNPDNVNARLWYELALSLLDQNFDTALRHMNYALKIDPLNLLILLRTGYLYVYKYDYDTAIHYFKKIISLEPDIVSGHHGLLDVYGLQGEYELAFAEGEIARRLGNVGPPGLAVLALYYGRGGNHKDAESILSTLLKRHESESISPFWIGVIYMGLNQFARMYEWFERALEERDCNLLYTFAPPFDPIRNDSEFVALRKKMGFNP